MGEQRWELYRQLRRVRCLTYRVGPHSSSDDPSRYRDEAVTRARATRDPVALMRARLLADGILSEASDAALTAELEAELERAVQIAELAPPPPASSLFEDVYAVPPRHLREQAEELRGLARS